jgi:type VI secretion system protein ImpB
LVGGGDGRRKKTTVPRPSSSKFIARNRAPRVQIEYEVDVGDAQKKIQRPHVMGILAGLSGKPAEPLPPVDERRMLEIDIDNFDDRLKGMKPRVAFPVPNTLTGEGNLSVDITFESMDDFSPARVAPKVDGVRELLDTRQKLFNLMAHLDGKRNAEELVGRMLRDSRLMQALTTAPKGDGRTAADEVGGVKS